MEKDIDRIPKNPDTDIVIRVDEFGGRRGVTIREFWRGERYTGFTKAGTKIPAEHFKAFKAAINSIDENELLEGVSESEGSQVLGSDEPSSVGDGGKVNSNGNNIQGSMDSDSSGGEESGTENKEEVKKEGDVDVSGAAI